METVKITFNSIGTSYGKYIDDNLEYEINDVCNNDDEREYGSYISIGLMTDKDGRLKEFDYIFIRDYLYYLFGKCNDLVRIKNIYRDTSYIDDCISEYILECGDIRIIIPYNKSMVDIFKIVDEYNIELIKNMKENDKLLKRQLKMEGF